MKSLLAISVQSSHNLDCIEQGGVQEASQFAVLEIGTLSSPVFQFYLASPKQRCHMQYMDRNGYL